MCKELSLRLKNFGICCFRTLVCLFCVACANSDDSANFQKISDVIDDAVLDIRYYSDNNFTGKRIRGYKAPVAYLTKKALRALAVAADDLRKQGYRLLVWDAYRPQKAVDFFAEWISDPNDCGDKTFYPNLKKTDLVSGQYVATKSSHSRGGTIDLSIVKKDGSFVDMGGAFDLFSEVSHRSYKNLTESQKRNRKILEDAMEKAGFMGHEAEWWHYTYKDEDYKDTYFDFDVDYNLTK